MNPRAQFLAVPKSIYSAGVLFFTLTENKFWLPDFFEFSLKAIDELVYGTSSLWEVSVSNAPSQFQRVAGLTFQYNNPFETTGHVMTLDFKYSVLQETPGGSMEVVRTYNTRTKLKIVVRSQPL